MPTTTYGDITPRTAAYATRKLLERAQALLMLERFGQTDVHGKNEGLTRTYRRYKSLTPATAPLAEGVTPAGQKLTYEDVSVTLEEYGDVVPLTNVIVDVHEDNKNNALLNNTSANCGEQAAETIELIRFEALKAGSNVFYANGVGSRGAVASAATVNDFRKIERFFIKNKAQTISEIIRASASYGTEPVAPAYFAFCHSDCKADIEDLTGFTSVEKYSSSEKSLPGEFGKLGSIRFLRSPLFDPWLISGTSTSTLLTNGTTGTGACDVYPIIVVAKDAYSIVPLQGKKTVKITVLNPNQPSKSDPLGQRGSVGWITMQAAKIITETFVCRLEVGARQL